MWLLIAKLETLEVFLCFSIISSFNLIFWLKPSQLLSKRPFFHVVAASVKFRRTIQKMMFSLKHLLKKFRRKNNQNQLYKIVTYFRNQHTTTYSIMFT
ncbi:hypothetical protein [Zunongwangia mangrovi]|uniref:hypothetical protein n=1 Tax=Zunongwangia mangrovi TaxID=1334022 RepID=UPI000B839F18|nr:hypothetical protein [Zunongwangia mangrovi]